MHLNLLFGALDQPAGNSSARWSPWTAPTVRADEAAAGAAEFPCLGRCKQCSTGHSTETRSNLPLKCDSDCPPSELVLSLTVAYFVIASHVTSSVVPPLGSFASGPTEEEEEGVVAVAVAGGW